MHRCMHESSIYIYIYLFIYLLHILLYSVGMCICTCVEYTLFFSLGPLLFKPRRSLQREQSTWQIWYAGLVEAEDT